MYVFSTITAFQQSQTVSLTASNFSLSVTTLQLHLLTVVAILIFETDISVALADTGEGAILPGWVYTLLDLVPLPYFAPSGDTIKWIKSSSNVFYAWHWYGSPKTPQEAVKNVQAISKDWNVPSFATEFGSCSAWDAANAANISHSYWHYSAYCNFPNRGDFSTNGIENAFGACILGWGGGSSSKCN